MSGEQTCERCGQTTWATILSVFNSEMICLECRKKEIKDPRYKRSPRAKRPVAKGDYNYPGRGR